ncbi:uncharacterized protein LOC111086792 [Limulus polyphemus]|uniref:Uncharacterized protein LOC111086792 n=1 Tax=Limulus polyphemus TaxID=6850 RepID=A0ABM1ST38_LIMPO|nr:uncharacterized protein LOC111086792 [Limulus polyphemus]XP_022246794.1 uncharacterized protein LOC111086792 [Limulus polyphemus]
MSDTTTTTIKKGFLWQQRDRFFSRWKERYFMLTLDYLACFKRGSKVGTSEMGSFQYKVNLADVDGLHWADKKQDGVISIGVGQEGQLLLWTPEGLDDWMFSLRDAMSRSKGRREVLRKSQTLYPQFSSTGLTKRHLHTLQHTLSDSCMKTSLMCRRNISMNLERLSDLRPVAEKQSPPQIGKFSDGKPDTSGVELFDENSVCIPFETDVQSPSRLVLTPQLAPKCSSGSYSSLVSLGRVSLGKFFDRSAPRSLQLSPALSQHSLYAQYIFSNPEVAPLSNSHFHKMGVSPVTSEIYFVHSDSPITSPNSRGNVSHSQSCKNQMLQGKKVYTRSVSCSSDARSRVENSLWNVPSGDDTRPCSIHDQPLLTIEKSSFSTQPPDLIPLTVSGQPALKQPYKRKNRTYSHFKSDSQLFNVKLAVNNGCPLKGSLEIR